MIAARTAIARASHSYGANTFSSGAGTALTRQFGQPRPLTQHAKLAGLYTSSTPKSPTHIRQLLQSPCISYGSTRSFHTGHPASSSFLGRWLSKGRGMRRRIGAWADSLGVTSTHVSRENDGSRTPAEMSESEELFVMPGWAVVKYREGETSKDGSPAPFDLHVSVSGFCSEARSPTTVSRAQRVIVSVVRRFAALPNLPGLNPEDQPMGPLPAAVGMAFLEQAAEDDGEGGKADRERHQPHNLPYTPRKKRTPSVAPSVAIENSIRASSSGTAAPPPGPSGSAPSPSRPSSIRSPSRQSSVSSTDTAFADKASIRTAHTNLNARLAPFWSSVLPSRRVLFDIYALPPDAEFPKSPTQPADPEKDDDELMDKRAPDQDPLHSFEFFTDNNGHFSEVVVVPWEKLCTTPSTVEAVYSSTQAGTGDGPHAAIPLIGWKLILRSRLDYEVLPVAESDLSYRQRIKRAVSSYGVDAVDTSAPRSTAGDPSAAAMAGMEKISLNTPGEPIVIEYTTIRVGSAGGVHIISDLDDTVKHSDILAGPREVFRNVFCRPLDEICVPDMDAMYRRLEDRGVAGFHFVSNSPSQLFPSIRRFLTVNSFPPRHSIKLKYYGGRSIFSSLYDSPAERKRSSLQELFRAFPTASFVMFGDSAEQDLELYMEFAKLFPERVAAVAIRDVTSDRAAEVYREVEKGGLEGLSSSASSSVASIPLVDEPADVSAPTSASTATSTSTVADAPSLHMPGEMPPARRPAPFLRTTSTASLLTDEDMRSLSSSQQKILQRAVTWQARMDKAEKERPKQMVLRFYKDPLEIEEEFSEIIERLK